MYHDMYQNVEQSEQVWFCLLLLQAVLVYQNVPEYVPKSGTKWTREGLFAAPAAALPLQAGRPISDHPYIQST